MFSILGKLCQQVIGVFPICYHVINFFPYSATSDNKLPSLSQWRIFSQNSKHSDIRLKKNNLVVDCTKIDDLTTFSSRNSCVFRT